jgi:nicotinamidase-related amidase
MAKHHPHILNAQDTVLVVIDMQEKLINGIFEPDRVKHMVDVLLQGAAILRVPILATTQNAVKLGPLLPEVKDLLPPLLAPYDKMEFSCMQNPSFASELQRSGRKQVLLAGIETHICVNQSAHEIAAAGYQVHIATDASSSRSRADWRIGIDKMRQAGILMSSTEMALYEMLKEAGTQEFREVLKLVK